MRERTRSIAEECSLYERFCGLFTEVRGKNRNSRKFTVASDRSDAAVSTRQQHGGTPLASKRSDLVTVVAPLCIKELRLVTMQLPEKFSSIGPGLKRTSP